MTEPVNKSTIALIDGDVLIYRAAWKAQKVIDWGNDLFGLVGDLNEARGHYKHLVHLTRKAAGAHKAVVVVSDPKGTTFRNKLYPMYKANRHKQSYSSLKPMVFKPLRDELISSGAVTYLPDTEGDDAMGVFATGPDRPQTIICTIDKDLRCIPGRHLNFDKKEEGIYEIGDQDAHNFHLTQTLAGDPTDGIPGIPGIGMKKATDWLTKEGFTWAAVVALYEKNNLGADEALLQARLTRILDASLWDDATKEVTYWSPAV